MNSISAKNDTIPYMAHAHRFCIFSAVVPRLGLTLTIACTMAHTITRIESPSHPALYVFNQLVFMT
jgi:hypothetical protein